MEIILPPSLGFHILMSGNTAATETSPLLIAHTIVSRGYLNFVIRRAVGEAPAASPAGENENYPPLSHPASTEALGGQ
jgi:hypothetical protein